MATGGCLDVFKDSERGNFAPVLKKDNKEDPEKCGLVSFNTVHGVVLEQITLETISKHIEDEKVIIPSQQEFKEEKSCLTNIIVCYNCITGSVNKGKAVGRLFAVSCNKRQWSKMETENSI